ncbi:MAG: CHAP domain-containing protein [Candidatus Ornithomonoglobus sp.]
MTAAQAINKVIQIAESEVGYLEKASNAYLYDKTANAGSANYTKYWADIAPSLQGEPWCAEFISWVLKQAFGQAIAAVLLGHFPYISCIKGREKAQAQNRWTRTPSVGAIIIFGDSNGTPCHTGLVRGYDDNYVYTTEGNTSGGSTVIANGGGVYRKSYTRGSSRILGYWRINYEYAAKVMSEKEGELTMTQYEELKALAENQAQEIAELKAKVAERTGYYNYIDENMPGSYKPTIQKLVGKGLLQGNEKSELMLTVDMMRILTILDRTGMFG